MDARAETTGILRHDIELLRGENMLLFDPGADAYFKVSRQIVQVISFLTEDLPLPDFLEKLHRNGLVIQLDELREIILFLRRNNLLIPGYGEVTFKQQQIEKMKKETRLLRFSASYLFFRLPPWRPEKLFDRLRPFISILSSRIVIIALLIPALLGYLLVCRDLAAVMAAFEDTLSWGGLVKYFAAILFLKVLHEAAHSIAATGFNCRVRGIGIGFMVFIPRLYTDTTDSWRLPGRQRLLIDAAGIISELLIGGISALLWSNSAPGPFKSTMFYIFTVSTISTLLVNGNPLIRYDGYYIFSDLLKIENLMSRSTACLKAWWRWIFLRIGAPPHEEKGLLLLLFGICSFIYRIFLYTSICLLIYYKFTKVLAVLMLFLEFYALLIYPCWQEFRAIYLLSRQKSGKSMWFLLFFVLLLISGILFFPLHWKIRLPGETVPQFRMPVTAEEAGYLTGPLEKKAFYVSRDSVIVSLQSPQLATGIERLEQMLKYDMLLYKLQDLDEKDFAQRNITAEKIASTRIALNELKRRRSKLQIKAARSGYFIPALPDLSAGAYVFRNTALGEIVSEKIVVHAYADDRTVSKIRKDLCGVIRLGDSLKAASVRVTGIDTIAARLEQSPVLQAFGGPIPVYPDEKGGFLPTQTLYRLELEITRGLELRPGRIVTVELTHREQLYTELLSFVLSFFRKEF